MNKFSLQEFLEKTLGAYPSNFKATSYDDANNQHVCKDQSTPNVYDFDAYVYENYDRSKLPASPDAIYIGKKNVYFVEFKNQQPGDIDRKNIRLKFRNGTEILKTLLADFVPKDCNYNFCVVFQGQKKPRFFDSRHIEKSVIQFGLEDLNTEFDSFY